MADITTPISNIPTGPMIPQEYQDQIDAAKQKQLIAQQLLLRSMQGSQPQQVGPVAAKISPLAGIANMLQGGVGAYMNASAQTDQSQAKNQYQNDLNAEIAKTLAMSTRDRSNAMMQSRFPVVQQWGQKNQEQQAKNDELISREIAQTHGPTLAAQYLLHPEQGVPAIPAGPPDRVEYRSDQNYPNSPPVPVIVSTDPKTGKEVLKSFQGGTQISMGPNEAQSRRAADQALIDAQRPKALGAQQMIANNNQAVEMLQQGASTGSLAETKQTIRKVLTGVFHIPADQIPETGPTENLINLLKTNLGEKAKTFGGNPSNIEDVYSNEIVGNLLTDPSALGTILGRHSGEAMKALQDYHGIIGAKQKQDTGKNYADLYEPALVGTDIPNLVGPPQYTLSAIKQLGNLGGDVSQFEMNQPNMGKGASGSSVQPFSRDSKFTISPNSIVPSIGPAAATPSAAVGRAKIKMPDGSYQQLNAAGTGWEPIP